MQELREEPVAAAVLDTQEGQEVLGFVPRDVARLQGVAGHPARKNMVSPVLLLRCQSCRCLI